MGSYKRNTWYNFSCLLQFSLVVCYKFTANRRKKMMADIFKTFVLGLWHNKLWHSWRKDVNQCLEFVCERESEREKPQLLSTHGMVLMTNDAMECQDSQSTSPLQLPLMAPCRKVWLSLAISCTNYVSVCVRDGPYDWRCHGVPGFSVS